MFLPNTAQKFGFASRIPVLPSGNMEQGERAAAAAAAESPADEIKLPEPDLSLLLPTQHPQLALPASQAKIRGCPELREFGR